MVRCPGMGITWPNQEKSLTGHKKNELAFGTSQDSMQTYGLQWVGQQQKQQKKQKKVGPRAESWLPSAGGGNGGMEPWE